MPKKELNKKYILNVWNQHLYNSLESVDDFLKYYTLDKYVYSISLLNGSLVCWFLINNTYCSLRFVYFSGSRGYWGLRYVSNETLTNKWDTLKVITRECKSTKSLLNHFLAK